MSDCLAKIISRNIWARGFDGDAPERFIGGIAVASAEIIKGSALIAAGLMNPDELIPLLLAHNEALPVGVVTSLTVVGDQVHFQAHLGQGFLCSGDIWNAIKSGELYRVSIRFDPLNGAPTEGTHQMWKALEISLVDIAADPNARITKCWERTSVAPHEITTFWKED